MVKKERPKFPDSYIGKQAKEYDISNWMERNQKNITARCVELLFDSNLGPFPEFDNSELLVLDLGCGTGFSTEILLEERFNVISIDILSDMIYLFRKKNIDTFNLILADIRNLPIRENKIDHIISVSSFNFIYEDILDNNEKNKILQQTVKIFKEVLNNNGRVILEFYPETEVDIKLLMRYFKSAGFNGFLVQDNPGLRKEQNFLILKKEEN